MGHCNLSMLQWQTLKQMSIRQHEMSVPAVWHITAPYRLTKMIVSDRKIMLHCFTYICRNLKMQRRPCPCRLNFYSNLWLDIKVKLLLISMNLKTYQCSRSLFSKSFLIFLCLKTSIVQSIWYTNDQECFINGTLVVKL